MFSIKNKIVVVAGGNGLLGKKIVNFLRKNHAVVISADLKHEKLLSDNYILDITNEKLVKEFLSKIIQKYNQIDGWVNCAYPKTKDWGYKFENITSNSWRKNIDMHLNGYFIASKIALEQMKVQKYGSLINFSSIYGHVGPDFNIYKNTAMTMPAAYSAIKGGINSMTRYLAAYYGKYKIRVNTISPGGVFDDQPESFLKNYQKKTPLGRLASPDDISPAVLFLLSDQSSYITGQNLTIDGGYTII